MYRFEDGSTTTAEVVGRFEISDAEVQAHGLKGFSFFKRGVCPGSYIAVAGAVDDDFGFDGDEAVFIADDDGVDVLRVGDDVGDLCVVEDLGAGFEEDGVGCTFEAFGVATRV